MEENKKEVVESTTEKVVEQVEQKEQPKVDDKVEKIKVKAKPKMKKLGGDKDIIKVDLTKKPAIVADPVPKESVDDVPSPSNTAVSVEASPPSQCNNCEKPSFIATEVRSVAIYKLFLSYYISLDYK